MLVYRDLGLRVGLVLFDEEPEQGVKIDRYLFYARTTSVTNAYCTEQSTLFLDLLRSPDELLAKVHKDTAYEIRRARDKDQVTCEWLDTNDPQVVTDFWTFFEQFSSTMGYPIPNKKRLSIYIRAGRFHISVSKTPAGEIVAYHAYVRGGTRIRLLHACSMHKTSDDSAHRALLGRANRWHFWWDILEFQRQGIALFDFGGWYARQDDPQMLRVNRFKERFGGEVTPTYMCNQGGSLKGKLAIWIGFKILRRNKDPE